MQKFYGVASVIYPDDVEAVFHSRYLAEYYIEPSPEDYVIREVLVKIEEIK